MHIDAAAFPNILPCKPTYYSGIAPALAGLQGVVMSHQGVVSCIAVVRF